MKKIFKKGFTLIELLAVIIILAVIALIATPIILNVINDAKKSTESSSIAYYASAVELTYAENMVNENKVDLRVGADNKVTNGKVFCETVGYLEGRGVILDKCTVNSPVVYSMIATAKADNLYYFVDKTVLTERPKDMDNIIASLDNEIDSDSKEDLEGVKSNEVVLKSFPELELSTTEAKGCLTNSDKNYTYMGGCYLKGIQYNNYIWFSGFLYRIMGINSDGSIKIISEESIASIPYGASSPKFEGSYVEKWLNEYFISHLNGANKIIDGTFCQNAIYNLAGPFLSTDCTEGTKLIRKAGLIEANEYNLAGTHKSYLNNKQRIWTMTIYNISDPKYHNKYVTTMNETGGYAASNSSGIYGIRPVINVKPDTIITGNNIGSEKMPYILNTDENSDMVGKLNEKGGSGEYVKFANRMYRIVSGGNGKATKLVLSGYYQEAGTNYKETYGNTASFTVESGIGKKLNEDVLNWLVAPSDSVNINKMTKISWYQNKFMEGYNYEEALKENDSPILATVGLINIGEIFSSSRLTAQDKESYWLLPYSGLISSKAIWISHFYAVELAVATINSYAIKPVINIKNDVNIIRGAGTLNSPYEI